MTFAKWRRWVSLSMALLIGTVGFGLPALEALASPPANVVPSPVAAAPTGSGPLVASLAASATGEPVVIDSYTSPTTEVLANPDGTRTARISAGPVRIPDSTAPSGWTPIDTTLEQTPEGIKPRATIVDLTFSRGGDKIGATVDLAGRSYGIEWPTPLPSPTLKGDTATYLEVQPGIDLVLRATPTGFEHSFVIKSPPKGQVSLQVPLALDGLVSEVESDGSLKLSKPNGDVFAESDPALMWDSTYDPKQDESLHKAKVKTSITQTASGPVLQLAPDPKFLTDPALVYPVTVDPTVDLSVSQDTYVEILFPNQTYSTDNELKVGAIDSSGQTQKARAFIKFATGPISGTHVTNATLKLYENYSYSCTGKKVNVYRLNSSWSGPTWNNQPTYGAIYASKTFAYGYSAACPNAWVSISGGGASGNTLTDLVQGWASGGIANNGLALRADSETDLTSWKKFNSSDAGGNFPQLEVTYNSYPNTPAGLSPVTNSFQTTAQPTLHGKFCDPDGGKGRVNFEIRLQSNSNLVVASSPTRARVSSCTDHPWSPGINPLTQLPYLSTGTVYKWRAQAHDGTDPSAWTSYRVFTVDTSAPSTPTISSSSHPDQAAWYPSSQTSLNSSWTAATDATSGVAGYGVKLDQNPTWAPTGSIQAGTTFSATLASAGIWYLHVAAKDVAGNWGNVANYLIHLGSSVVLSPSNLARTQRYFELQGETSPTNTSARFQYRLSPSDALGWRDIPPADVTFASNGQPIGSWDVSLTAGKTPKLTWNAAATLGAVDGPVQLRVFSASAGSGPANVELDQNIAGAGAAVGPGVVDLVTGNFSMSEMDANMGGMGIHRTFNSRTPQSPNGGGIFGPGWSAGLEWPAPWVALRERTQDGVIEVLAASGDSVFFMKNTDNSYSPSPETPQTSRLAYDPASGGSYTLRDNDNVGTDVTETVFTKPQGATDFTPSVVRLPASDGALAMTFQVVGTTAQPTMLVDSPPSGVNCAGSPLSTKGCKTLQLTYATSTTATGTSEASWGDFAGRLKLASFTSWNPSTSAMTTVPVAQYLYDSLGLLRAAWDPRVSPALKTRYSYDAAAHVTTVTPPSLNPWTFTYGTIAGDANGGRLLSVSRAGDPSGVETSTVGYAVPLTGANAPKPMSASDVAGWGQIDFPVDATAIFPPGHEPANPPSNYQWAQVFYLDANARTVNVLTSDGSGGTQVDTTEFDAFGNVVRTLSPEARAQALAKGSTPAEDQAWAALLDTRYVFDGDGIELTDTYGPQHSIELSTGSIVDARIHTHVTYDENAPGGGTYHLPTTETEGALLPGANSDIDVATSKTTYIWETLQPIGVTVDPAGLNLKSSMAYDSTTGQATKSIMPANPLGGDARETQYIYYVADASSGDSECNGKAEWVGELCKVRPAAQPATGNTLPVTKYTYDMWGNLATRTETTTSPPAVRVWSYTYDPAGRPTLETVTGPGSPVPDVSSTYNPANGLLATTSSGGKTVSRVYDALGRMSQYTDADGNIAGYAFDLQDRLTSASDGKGVTQFTYDGGTERRGLLTSLSDSQAGTFAVGYDANGSAVSQTWPNGMQSTQSFDVAGNPTSIVYTKTSNCSTDCDWFAEQVIPSVHRQSLSRNSSLSSQDFSYDAAGRLAWTYDTVAGQCTTRQYGYDADSNRLSLTSRAPGADGACTTTGSGTVTSTAYDEADRVKSPGFALDAFGRITDVPASHNAGQQISSSYFENDLLSSITAGGITATLSIDPMNRIRSRQTPSLTQTWHYVSDSDSPAWIAENPAGTAWTRNVAGPDGSLVASVDQTGAVTLQLSNLHGDIVATASADGQAPALLTATDQTEFGVPRTPATSRYAWVGAESRTTDAPANAILMGARTYIPSLGRFLQVEPIKGGSANDYDYCAGDPVNCIDPSGQYSYTFPIMGGRHPVLAFGAMRLHCAAVFPLDGCPSYFHVGSRFTLIYRFRDLARHLPVRVSRLSLVSTTWVGTEGHPAGVGSKIQFSMSPEWNSGFGFWATFLYVNTWDITGVLSWPVVRGVYGAGAYYTWRDLALNLGRYIRNHYDY